MKPIHKMQITYIPRLAVAVLIAGITLTACTSSSHSVKRSSPVVRHSSGVSSITTGQRSLPKETVGIVDVTASDPGALLLQTTAAAAMKHLGWSVISLNAAGDPATEASDVATLVNEHVDAILLDADNPATMGAQLTAAHAAHIPVILYGGAGSYSPYVTSIVPDDFTLAAIATNYIFNSFNGHANIAVITSAGVPFAANRTALLNLELKQYPGIHIVATLNVNYATYSASLLSATRALVEAHPNIQAIYTTISPYPVPESSALAALGKTASIPIVGFYTYPSEITLLKEDKLQAVADTSLPQNAYQAVDALVQYFGKHQPITAAEQYTHPLVYSLITKANLNVALSYPSAAAKYYDALWAKEFTSAS